MNQLTNSICTFFELHDAQHPVTMVAVAVFSVVQLSLQLNQTAYKKLGSLLSLKLGPLKAFRRQFKGRILDKFQVCRNIQQLI